MSGLEWNSMKAPTGRPHCLLQPYNCANLVHMGHIWSQNHCAHLSKSYLFLVAKFIYSQLWKQGPSSLTLTAAIRNQANWSHGDQCEKLTEGERSSQSCSDAESKNYQFQENDLWILQAAITTSPKVWNICRLQTCYACFSTKQSLLYKVTTQNF